MVHRGDTVDPHLITTMLDDDAFALEQYSSLCTKVISACESSGKNCLLVTSSVPSEGKSLNALNLAITIAKMIKEEVILVDGDLRHPALHTLLGIQTNYGLANCFQENSRFLNKEDVLLEKIIRPSGIEHLSLIPAGRVSSNPSEILSSKKMPLLIAELKRRQKNSYLIIDSPPLIPTSDPIILSRYVDWIILVIQAGKTPREIIRKAVDQLETEKILGLVLNNLDYIPYEYSYAYKPYYNRTYKT